MSEDTWETRVCKVTLFFSSCERNPQLVYFCKGKAETGSTVFSTKTQGERQYRDEP